MNVLPVRTLNTRYTMSIDLFFFFQAEDGIRDYKVTGVQTCALPICAASAVFQLAGFDVRSAPRRSWPNRVAERVARESSTLRGAVALLLTTDVRRRSEERRVGKGVDLGGRRIIKKKKKKELELVLD